MEQTVLQKIGKIFLIGFGGLLIVSLFVVFMMVVLVQGSPNGKLWHNKLMWGQDTSFRNKGNVGMMSEKVEQALSEDVSTLSAPQMMLDVANTSGDEQVLSEDRKIMKNGTLDIRVESADETLKQIQKVVESRGGSLVNTNFSRGTDALKSGVVTIKVPVAKFEETFGALKEVATLIVNESISGTDVTEQFIDFAARLKNKKAQEEALQNILHRAIKVSDVIEVTNALGTIRGEIESLEGQIRYLNSQTEMASISIFITEDTRVVGDEAFRPWQTVSDSLQTLFKGIGRFVEGIIALMILGIPILLMYGLILWGVYRGVKKLVQRFLH